MPASWRTFTQAARHCSSKPYSRSNSASVSPRMIARIVPNSPFTTILPSYSQKYNGRGDWLISGVLEDLHQLPALVANPPLPDAHLTLDRGVALPVPVIPAVDDGAHKRRLE